jgi:hypothetical protein
MPKVRIASGALNFGSLHSVARVGLHLDVLVLHRIPKARPARTRLKFLLGMEKVRSATNAAKNSVFMKLPVLAGEGALRAPMPRHLILFRRKDFLPFRICLHNFVYAHFALLTARNAPRCPSSLA